MSADAFLVYYGIRWETEEETEINSLQSRNDPRLIAARANNLQHWWGPTIEEGRYFLLIGSCLGNLGGEGHAEIQLTDEEFAKIQAETKNKLRAAKFTQEAKLYLQYEPDH